MSIDSNDTTVVKGSGNVFADLDLTNADELLAKARLASVISDIVSERNLTQAAAAKLLGTSQPHVSNLSNGRLEGFSLERLARFLTMLDRDVDIVVRRRPATQPTGRLRVTLAPRA